METLIKKFSKMGTVQVIAQLERGITGDIKQACIEILKKRGQDISQWENSKPSMSAKKPTVFEAEPEERLSPKEEKAIKAALKERDEDSVSVSLRAEKDKSKVASKETKKPEKKKTTTSAKKSEPKEKGEPKVSKGGKNLPVSVENPEVAPTKVVFFTHDGQSLTGEVRSIFKSCKTGKEICKIALVGEAKKFIHKRVNRLVVQV